jgi:hypothetical protein
MPPGYTTDSTSATSISETCPFSEAFVTAQAGVLNLFNLARHAVRAQRYHDLSVSTFDEWGRAVA